MLPLSIATGWLGVFESLGISGTKYIEIVVLDQLDIDQIVLINFGFQNTRI